MIPEDLGAICVLPHNEDIAPLYPPIEIAQAVERILSKRTQDDDETTVAAWIENQQALQERAAALIEKTEPHLVDVANEGLPGWIRDDWFFTIKCPWSAGLENAVIAGEAALGE